MDQDVINLAKSIRQQESANDFTRKGASGEYGAYQWMPDTWKEHAKFALGNANAEMTPDNQQAVAYTMIKTWKDQNLNPAQIAAKWNSGSENGWENKIGTNKQGVKYNVPAYVKAVTDNYQTFKAQTPEQSQVPQEQISPIGQLNQNITDKAKQAYGEDSLAYKATAPARFLGKAVDFLSSGAQKFGQTVGNALNLNYATDEYSKALNDYTKGTNQLVTLINKKEKAGQDTTALRQALDAHTKYQPKIEDFTGDVINKSPEQVLGEAGQTVLEASSGGALSGGASAVKGATTFGGKVAQGAKIGAGYGALGGGFSGMAQDKSLGGVAKDVAIGGAVGGALGGTLGAVGAGAERLARSPEIKAQKIQEGRIKELDQLDNYMSVKKIVNKANERGIDVKKLASDSDILVGAVDKNGTINTIDTAIPKLNEIINPQETVVRDLLKREGSSVYVDDVYKQLLKSIDDSGIEGSALIRARNAAKLEARGLLTRADNSGRVPTYIVHDAKVQKYANINYLDKEKQVVDKAIAKGLKQTVETYSNEEINKINQELSKWYTLQDYLEKLNGKKVEGGRLGKYFAKTIGAIVGGHFGPLGSVVGAEVAGGIKGAQMASKFSKTIGKDLERSPILEKASQRAGSPRPQSNAPEFRTVIPTGKTINLPEGQSNILGNRQINQASTIAPTNKFIPNTVAPTETKTSGLSTRPNMQAGFISTGSNIDNSLIQEAKKYKSAEDIIVYRGGEKFDPSKMKTSGKAIGSYFSTDKNFAEGFTNDILSGKTGKGLENVDTYKYVIKKGANIATPDIFPTKFKVSSLDDLKTRFGNPHKLQDEISKWALKNGFDVVDYIGNGKNMIILNSNIIK